MMRQLLVMCVVMGLVVGFSGMVAAENEHRIGIGVHYFTKLGDIELDDIEEEGLAWMITYQLRPESLIKFEADLEQLPEGFQGLDKDVYAPQAYVLVGDTIYAAAGVGIYFSDGEFADDPFYALRAGLDIALLPFIHADINVNYRFEDWDEVKGENIDEDTLTMGVAVRMSL